MTELDNLKFNIKVIKNRIKFLTVDMAQSKKEIEVFKERLQEKLLKLKRLQNENSSGK